MRKPSRVGTSIVTLLVVTALSACGDASDRQTEEPARWSMSFVWSASEDIDMTGVDMTLIRAYAESDTVSAYLGNEYGYRIGGKVSDGLPEDPFDNSIHEGTGTAYLHAVRAHRVSEPTIYVCRDMTSTAKVVDGKYIRPQPRASKEESANRAQNSDIDVFIARPRDLRPNQTTSNAPWEKFGKTPAGPILPGPPGRVARPANVEVERYTLFSPAGVESVREEIMEEVCDPWLESRRQQHPDKVEPTDPNIPPAIEPFYPGWPS